MTRLARFRVTAATLHWGGGGGLHVANFGMNFGLGPVVDFVGLDVHTLVTTLSLSSTTCTVFSASSSSLKVFCPSSSCLSAWSILLL